LTNLLNSRPFHSADLRKGRVSEVGRAYLLTTVVESRQPVFADWRVGRRVVAEMKATQTEGRVESLAWVLMPDHLHWLLILRQGDLATLMRRFKSYSAISVNQALASEGQIWQKGYHDHAVRNEEDLQVLARYVVANPLRAGLVKRLGEYPLWDAKWL
jgi:putative transposase